jgi:hypothetical protein
MMSDNEAAEFMPFGEHAGLRFYEMAADHAAYCAWIVTQPWLDPVIAGRIRRAIAEVEMDTALEREDDDYDDWR